MTDVAAAERARAAGAADPAAARDASSPLRPATRAATTGAVALAILAFAYDHGGYAVESRNLAALLVWSALLFGLAAGLWRGRRLGWASVVAGTSLTALAVLAAASAGWAPGAERALDDACRTLLYAGVFWLVALSVSERTRAAWADGVAAGVTMVVAVALVSRFFPSVFGSRTVLRLGAGDVSRLSYPIGYWNGLAVLAALGVPMLLCGALTYRHPLLRGLALAPLPAFAALLYLTSSRGGAVAASVGIVLFFAFVSRRAATLGALAVATPAAVAAVFVLRGRQAIVDGPFTSPAARDAGHASALWVALACVACGVVYAALVAVAPSLRIPRRVETALLWVGIVAVGVAVAVADPVARFDAFRRLPGNVPGSSTVESHLLSTSGTGRWQLWEAAADAFRTRPVLGRGAGSYEAWQTQHGSLGLFVHDAHSAYLQTLAELGIVGFALFAAALLAGIAAGVAALGGQEPGRRVSLAAALAALAAFVVASAFDWVWQLPAVAVVGVISLGIATAAGPWAPVGGGRGGLRVWRVVLAAVAAAAIVAEGVPLLSQLQLDSSRSHAAKGELPAAVRAASRARALMPWNATPYLQVALVAEQGGNLRAGREWIAEARRRDPTDWRLWLTSARIETESGRIAEARRSLDRARTLNPRLPFSP